MISVGFPGTVASLRQQWGRAGRRGNGLAVLVASEDGLDQFFMREPDKLLGRRVEAAILDHANPRVLAGHVRAAAYEAPLDDARRASCSAPRRSRPRATIRELKQTPAGIVWAGKEHPAAQVPLRSTDPDAFTIVDAHDRRGARPRRARRARTRPCTRARSTCTSASRSSCASST